MAAGALSALRAAKRRAVAMVETAVTPRADAERKPRRVWAPRQALAQARTRAVVAHRPAERRAAEQSAVEEDPAGRWRRSPAQVWDCGVAGQTDDTECRAAMRLAVADRAYLAMNWFSAEEATAAASSQAPGRGQAGGWQCPASPHRTAGGHWPPACPVPAALVRAADRAATEESGRAPVAAWAQARDRVGARSGRWVWERVTKARTCRGCWQES